VVIVVSDRVEVRIPTLILEERTTMTHATMALAELAEKGPDVDMLRQMVQFAAQRLMDGAEHEAMSSMDFPRAHGLRIHRRNPLERLNAEIRRRTHVVGLFPNDAAITRLVGAMLLEQNDEWSLNRRHMRLEVLQSPSDTAPTRGPAFQR
jgi:hypothetical protein